MNVENLKRLRAFVARSEDVRLGKGCSLLDHCVRLIMGSQTIESGPNPPSPAEFLGLSYDEAAVLFENRPRCEWCTDAELDRATELGVADFDSRPAHVRKGLIVELLTGAIDTGTFDWRWAKLRMDIEVSA